MTLEEASKKFKIEVRNLKRMAKKNLISDPLTDKDIDRLKFLSHFWGKQFWLKRQLARHSVKRRMDIIHTAGMTKVESYIYNRYAKANAEGKKVNVKRVAEEVNDIYGLQINERLIKLIYSIRKKVRNKRFYQKQKSID